MEEPRELNFVESEVDENGVPWSERLKAAQAAVDKEGERWAEAKLPNIKDIWRMNNDEFMYHVELHTIRKLIKEKLGISTDEYLTILNETFLEEAKKGFDQAAALRKDAMRAAITSGIRPEI